MRTICGPPSCAAYCVMVAAGLIAAAMMDRPARAESAGAQMQSEASNTAASGTASAHRCDGGVRVTSTRWDAILHRSWAVVVPCGHPDWPASEMPGHGLAAGTNSSSRTAVQTLEEAPPLHPLVVWAGDVVQLWSQQGSLRIEAAAIAEQGGSIGQTVRVRLALRKTLGQQVEEQFRGVIRGPRNVEMSQ